MSWINPKDLKPAHGAKVVILTDWGEKGTQIGRVTWGLGWAWEYWEDQIIGWLPGDGYPLNALADLPPNREAPPQELVYTAVKQRGYRSGWTSAQYFGRNVAKLVEEVGELVGCQFDETHRFHDTMMEAGDEAREAFDDLPWWRDADVGLYPGSIEETKAELADIQVVLFQLAAMVEEITGKPYDVVEAAVAKGYSRYRKGCKIAWAQSVTAVKLHRESIP